MQHCALPGAVFRQLEATQTLSEAFGVWLADSSNVLVPKLLQELDGRQRAAAVGP